MFGSMGRALNLREQASKAPREQVTRATFIRRCVTHGMNKEEAVRQARLVKILGSEALIGGVMLSIK